MKHTSRTTRNGFIFYMVIAALALTGSAFLLLTRMSNEMAFHSDQMYFQLCRRNLSASAAAWTRLTAERLPQKLSSGSYHLDATDLQIPAGRISISTAPNQAANQVTIEVRCSGRKITVSKEYNISLTAP